MQLKEQRQIEEEQRKQRQREYKLEYSRALYLARRQAGVCVGCHRRDAMPGKAYCPACRIRNAVYQTTRDKHREVRQ